MGAFYRVGGLNSLGWTGTSSSIELHCSVFMIAPLVKSNSTPLNGTSSPSVKRQSE